MKRILTIVFLLVLNFTLKAQIPQEPNTYGYNFKRVGADSLLWIPKDTLSVPSWGVGKTHIARKGTTLYYWDGSKWSAVTGTSIDTTSLSNRINLKLNISDTASMLTNYVRRQELKDTAAAIRASIGGGGGGSQTLQQVLTTGSTLTTNNTIASGANSLTFSNNRGTVVFDNSSQPLVKLNGTGLAPLFQVDSGGYTRFRIYPKGQIFAGDSINLNLFMGYNSGLNIAPEGAPGNPPGRWNVSLGTNTLRDIVNGNDNIAIGQGALMTLVNGTHNIAIGTATQVANTTGDDNVSIGVDALANNNSNRNTTVGSYGQYLATGQENTSLGYASLYGTVAGTNTGSYNTAIGYSASKNNTSSSSNTSVGYNSLFTQTTGSGFAGSNTAVGSGSGYTTNGDYNLFLGNYSGYYSNESNAFYLHTLTSGISNENDGKNYSMFYGKFANAGANKLRMNGKFGIHSTNNDAAWLPDSAFHVVGNSWLNGKLRITDGTQSNGYVLTSDASGNATWQAASGGMTNPMTTAGDLILGGASGTPTRLAIGTSNYVLTSNGTTASWQPVSAGAAPGNYGNITLNRNGSLSTPGSDSVGYTTSGGFVVKNNATLGVTSSGGATLNIAAKDATGKVSFQYDGIGEIGVLSVNSSSGVMRVGSDYYPLRLISSGNEIIRFNSTNVGINQTPSITFDVAGAIGNTTGTRYGYIQAANSDANPTYSFWTDDNNGWRSPAADEQSWITGGTERMRLSSTGLGIGGTPSSSAKLTVTSTTQGFLPPRMTGTQAEAISSPAEGLMIYSTDGSGTTITSKGWWGYDGTNWVKLN